MSRTARVTLIAAVTFLVMEAGVRAIDSALPEINAWREPMAAAKVDQMDGIATSGPTDVVLAGSSQMLFAGDPAMLNSLHAPWSAYNAGLWGAPPVVNEHWLTEVVIPRVRPRTVFLGVSPLDFIEPVGDVVETYFTAPAVRDDWLGKIERHLSGVSALVRHRRELRSPLHLYEAFIRRLHGRPPSVQSAGIDSGGRLLCCDDRAFNPEILTVATRAFRNEVGQHGWEVSDEQVGAFRRTVSTLGSRGTEVVVVAMPISSPLIDLLGREEYSAYLSLLKREVLALRVPILDMAGGVEPTTFFFDYDHLNRAGANVFNTVLARALASSPPGSLKEKAESLPTQPLAPNIAADVLERENALAEANAPAQQSPSVEPPIPGAPAATPTPPVDIPALPTPIPRIEP